MNKVILMGRLTRDPEIRYSQGENSMPVAKYTIAVERRFKGSKEATADFVPYIAFKHNAEIAEKYFYQGTKILITGHIQTGSYIKQDAQKVYTTDVIVEEQEFAESKRNKEASSPDPDPNGFCNVPDGVNDEDLPFN